MFRTTIKISLFCVFMVIIAGSIVRMTGSGMGCPDWPKCFGHLIPPTEKSQLLWKPHHPFHEGQIIIKNEHLEVAVSDFTSGSTYTPENWKIYTKHDYAEFNAYHTWVEFINRLFGMLSGISVFIMAVIGTFLAFFRYKKYKKRILFTAWLSVFLIGVAAWLGAVVVYTVLDPLMITIHMITSIFIIADLLYLLKITQKQPKKIRYDKHFKQLMTASFVITFLQIVLGTRVRQFVDTQVDLFGYDMPAKWLADPNWAFFVHREFSIIILVLNAYLWWRNKKMKLGHQNMNRIMGLILIEIVIGIAMYYFDFPFLSQPLHLLIALLLFTAQFYVVLHLGKSQSKMIVTP